MEAKVCKRCQCEKPISAFGTNMALRSGLNSQCKECRAMAYRTRYNADPQLRECRSKYMAERTRTGRNKEAVRLSTLKRPVRKRNLSAEESRARWLRGRMSHPDAWAAYGVIRYALRTGKLIKAPCCICGAAKADAHHADYSKPLDVRWLCKQHHGAWHRLFGVA